MMVNQEREVRLRGLSAEREIMHWALARIGRHVEIGVHGSCASGTILRCDLDVGVIVLLCATDRGDC